MLTQICVSYSDMYTGSLPVIGSRVEDGSLVYPLLVWRSSVYAEAARLHHYDIEAWSKPNEI